MKVGTKADASAPPARRLKSKFGKILAELKASMTPARTESTGGQDLADQAGDLTEGKGNHDGPGGAGDLLVGRLAFSLIGLDYTLPKAVTLISESRITVVLKRNCL